MAPKKVVFDRRTIIAAALPLVREEGWDALTARRVAEKLGASVAPLYKTFGSMADLERVVLEEARRLLEERTRMRYTEMEFLNIGVGVVEFARDEPNLFRAIYQTRHGRADIVQTITDSILARMKQQPLLDRLSEASLRRLLDNIRLYTLGLATAVVAGWWPDSSTAAIVRELGNMGHILTFAEAAGIADGDSPQSRAAWSRLLGKPGGAQMECPMEPGTELPESINNERFFEED
jgi:AcrR family transcriptional regulator